MSSGPAGVRVSAHQFFPSRHPHHPHYPSRQLACRTATKLLHPRLSLASLWMVPQLCVVHVLHFSFHSSSPGCLQSTTLPLPLFLWGPVDSPLPVRGSLCMTSMDISEAVFYKHGIFPPLYQLKIKRVLLKRAISFLKK